MLKSRSASLNFRFLRSFLLLEFLKHRSEYQGMSSTQTGVPGADAELRMTIVFVMTCVCRSMCMEVRGRLRGRFSPPTSSDRAQGPGCRSTFPGCVTSPAPLFTFHTAAYKRLELQSLAIRCYLPASEGSRSHVVYKHTCRHNTHLHKINEQCFQVTIAAW